MHSLAQEFSKPYLFASKSGRPKAIHDPNKEDMILASLQGFLSIATKDSDKLQNHL
jgi:hypothetical protein